MSTRERLYESVLTRLSPDKAAWLDQHRPSVRSSWGWGPLNGQVGRQGIVRDLARAVAFDEVVETGTYRGNSTEFFAHVLGVPIHTVEAHPRYYHYAAKRLAPYPDVTVELGDSREILRRLGERPGDPTTLFYLDAHWEQDLPLREEVEIIAKGWQSGVVVIDDFEVAGRRGLHLRRLRPRQAPLRRLPSRRRVVAVLPVAALRAGVRRATGLRRAGRAVAARHSGRPAEPAPARLRRAR